jgi:uncharacterized protein (TIGR02444 family)
MIRNAEGSDTTQATPDHALYRAPDKAGEEGAAFWRFSLALYASPGVADALIALQDRAGLDVNLILFGLWIGARHGCELGPEGFAAAAVPVAELNGVIRNIRALRRQLRDAADSDIRNLWRALLRLELAAERQVQRRLTAHVAAGTLPHRPGDQSSAALFSAVLANLACSLGNESDSPEAAALRHAIAGLMRRA